jgi:hypothetical protein
VNDTAPVKPKLFVGMCLLHGDYHPMDQTCWDATLDFYFDVQLTRPNLDQTEIKQEYDAEVERRMLRNVIDLNKTGVIQ